MECKGRGQLTPQSLIMESSKISCASTRLSEKQLTAFLLHIGYLMGYNNRPAKIVDEEIEEEPAAEQEMDEEEEERRAVENIEEFNLY
uniref:Uncharacterized protein n=1 Tax=Ditylenchus dipsaci TaxID=166011 RepID=A0A915D1I1_9BILA